MDARAAKRSAYTAEIDDPARQHYVVAGREPMHMNSAFPTTAALNNKPSVDTGAGVVLADADADAGQTDLVPPRKRKRRVISCAECHRRKQKCDRGLPCRACIDRKMEASCYYETVAMSRERHHTRIIEAATYGRALQEGGTIEVKTAGFGYAQTSANTLGFLHKIDGGRLASLDGSNVEAGCETGTASLASTASEGSARGAVASRSNSAGLTGDTALYQQQRHRQLSSSSPSTSAPQQQESSLAINPQNPSFDHRRFQRPHVGDPYGMGERYRALVRELPSRAHIDYLAGLYFRDFNWNYYAIDDDVFAKQLGDWMDIAIGPFGAPQSPVQMSPDLRAFPALLFNVIAMGLLVLDTSKKEDMDLFDSIKRPNCKTFEDLALEYSETGLVILSLLGKRQMSYTTVLAGFARSAFLKYAALITEAVSRKPFPSINRRLSSFVSTNFLLSGTLLALQSAMPRRSACTDRRWIRSHGRRRLKQSSKTSGRLSAAGGCG